MQSEDIKDLAAAIVRAQKKLKPAKMNRTNPFYGSKYADIASVTEALKPFTEEGIAITQANFECEGNYIGIETQLTHADSGQWKNGFLKLPLAKADPQGAGSAITYARRYALGCMTGLVTDEDTDGNVPRDTKRQEDGAHTPEKVGTSQQGSDAPASYIVPIGYFKGKTLDQVTLKGLDWLQSALEKNLTEHQESPLVDQWREGVLAIEEELSLRGLLKP